MENVKIYSASGIVIDLALDKVNPRQVKVIQKDQITPQVLQAHGASIAVASLDGQVIHVGEQINPQFLIREFGWRVGGVEPYRPSSKVARLLDKKREGLDPRTVALRLESESKAQRDAEETGTSRAEVTKLDVTTAKKAALNVVATMASADREEGAGAEPPSMPGEPETAPGEPDLSDPAAETEDEGDVSQAQGDAPQDAPEGEAAPDPALKPTQEPQKGSGKKGKKGKRGK